MVFFLFLLLTLGPLLLVFSTDLLLFFSTSGVIAGCGEGLLVFFKGFSYGPNSVLDGDRELL